MHNLYVTKNVIVGNWVSKGNTIPVFDPVYLTKILPTPFSISYFVRRSRELNERF